jgi:hypothetical protein
MARQVPAGNENSVTQRIEWIGLRGINSVPILLEIRIGPDKRGGLKGSMQHLLAVYLLEFEIPKSFLDADLI